MLKVCEMSNLFYPGRDDRPEKLKEPSSSDKETNRVPEESDQGPVLVVIALVVFFAVLIGLFASATKAAEADPKATDAASTEAAEKQSPPSDWKPPVTPKVSAPSPIDPEQNKQIQEEWGVEIISLNLTAAGYMMDFRFRVHDVEKSKIFFDSRIKPYLHVEKSNAKLPVPMAAKVGAFRATNRGKNIKPNKIYYIVFGNPDAHVKSGEKVTLVVGDFKAEHLTVH